MRLFLSFLSFSVCLSAVPSFAVAQVTAVEFGSAEAEQLLNEFRERQREDRKAYTNAKVLLEEKLWLTPSDVEIAKDIAIREAQRPTDILTLKGEITALQKRKAATRDKSERADIDKAFAACTAKLRLLESKDPASAALLRPRLPLDKLEVGAFGVLEIDSDSGGPYGKEILFVATQVIDSTNLIAKYGRKFIWISNVSTDGIIDGQYVRLTNVMKVTRTKTYKTALGGSSTVFVVEPVDPRPADAAMATMLAERKGRTTTPPKRVFDMVRGKSFRTWTSATGEFNVDAEFLAMAAGQVMLSKTDGTMIIVPLEKLCDDDKEWIDARRK